MDAVAGQDGEMEFFTTDDELYYCDNTDWIPMRWKADESRSLVSHWRLDETSGTTYADSVGNNDGTYSEVAVDDQLGVLSNAAGFSATDDSISAGSDISLDIPTGTLALWFNTPNATDTVTRHLFSKDNSGVNYGDWSLRIRQSSAGSDPNHIDLFVEDGTGSSSIRSDNAISANRWTHLVLLWGTGGMEMYVNGVLQADTDVDTTGMTNQAASAVIGNLRAGANNDFDGKIDDVRLYDYRLSADEIRILYESYGLDANLVAWWKMDETTGTDFLDSAGGSDASYDGGATVVSATGIIDTAGDFTASDVEADAGSDASLDVATGTLTAWFKTPNAGTGSNRYIFAKDGSGTNDGDWGLYIEDSGAGGEANRVKCIIQDSGSNNAIVADDPITADAWHHVAMLFGTGGMEMYINGIRQSDTDTETQGMMNASANGIIGNLRVGNSLDFDGEIDDVRLYDRRLTQGEIEDLFMTGQFDLSTSNGLVMHLPLDETSGTTVTDETGNGTATVNNLTLSSDNYSAPNNTGLLFDDNGGAGPGNEDGIGMTLGASAASLNNRSYSVWLNTANANTGGLPRIYEYFGASGAGFHSMRYRQQDVRFVIWDGGAGSRQWFTTANPISDDTWHHIAVTYNNSSTANDPIIYVDGTPIATSTSGTASNVSSPSTSATLRIGNRQGLDQSTDAVLDDFRIYDRVLTPAEVNALMFQGRDNGIVGHWRLDETAGTNAEDSTVAQNDGTMIGGLTGTDSVTAIIDTGLDFDGSDDEIDVGSPDELDDITGDYTICAWINPDSFGQGSLGRIVSKHSSSSEEGIELFIDDTDDHIRIFHDDSSGGTQGRSNDDVITLNVWQQVCVVHTDDGGEVAIYHNAVDVTDDNNIGDIETHNSRDFFIGNKSDTNNREFDGGIDDVRVYTKTLSPNDILSLYEEGPGLQTGLVGHWKLDETTGTTAVDASGYGNDGTMNGGLDAANNSVPSPINTALAFDGINDHVELPDDVFDNLAQGTVALWVNWDGSTGEYSTMWQNTSGTDFQPLQIEDNDIYLFSDPGCSPRVRMRTTNDPISANTWHHIVYASDPTGNKFYIDGVRQTTNLGYINGSATDNMFFNQCGALSGTSQVDIGGRGGSEAFPGNIDDVRVYDRALSDAEVLELYELRGTLGTGLVGWWKLDETSGTTAYDSSGYGNAGTMGGGLSGTDSVEAKVDTGLDFDGSNDNINTTLSQTLTASEDFSFAAWFKLEDPSISVDNNIIFGDGPLNSLSILEIEGDGSTGCAVGQIVFSIRDVDGVGSAENVCSSTFISDGEWYHATGVFDHDGNIAIYLNGVLENTFPVGAGSDGSLIQDPIIIGSSDAPSQYFNGVIDDARVYNRALTASEAYALAHCSGPGVWNYNYNDDYKQWCDGFKPIEMHRPASGTGGCTGGQEGSLRYETDRYEACDGNGWIDIGK